MSKAKSAEGETAIWNKGAACVKAGRVAPSLYVLPTTGFSSATVV